MGREIYKSGYPFDPEKSDEENRQKALELLEQVDGITPEKRIELEEKHQDEAELDRLAKSLIGNNPKRVEEFKKEVRKGWKEKDSGKAKKENKGVDVSSVENAVDWYKEKASKADKEKFKEEFEKIFGDE